MATGIEQSYHSDAAAALALYALLGNGVTVAAAMNSSTLPSRALVFAGSRVRRDIGQTKTKGLPPFAAAQSK